MSYGVFNWWWGEDTEDSDWSWLIHRLNEIVDTTATDYQDGVLTILTRFGNRSAEIGILDFRYLPLQALAGERSKSWHGFFAARNTELVPSGETTDSVAHIFAEMMNQYPDFYEEIIKKGNPFVFIPSAENYPLSLWWGGEKITQVPVDEREVFHLMAGIFRPSWQGDGYVCINPEANRIITQYLSNVWTSGFEQVADFSGWDYPSWYAEG
jgi:hypothetical protein